MSESKSTQKKNKKYKFVGYYLPTGFGRYYSTKCRLYAFDLTNKCKISPLYKESAILPSIYDSVCS